ncbi:MAG: beta-ketoacyl synthase chain length factor [Thermoanaerobaculia bacterium]|nr:beta-ketoacyl synthase chain length factor [Thermoanaerobaculia bacterium]
MSRESVVVTGLGTILGCGPGRTALAEALASGRPHLAAVDTSSGYHLPGGPRLASLAHHVDLSPWLPPRAARRLSQPSKFAVAAARMALEGAVLTADDVAEQGTAVVLATAFGTARFAEALIRDILTQGPEAASPFHFSESVANAPAAQVAIALGAHGANVAVTQREAGPILAVAAGAREIELGRSRLALVGATDEINPLVHAILGRFRALAMPDAAGHEQGRPFDPERNGFHAAEGSTVLVLEGERSARLRGVEVLARVRSSVRAFDPTAPPHDWGHGAETLADRLRAQLQRDGLEAKDFDLVVSGASGSRRGDALESDVLNHFFAAGRIPPIATPKSVVGEYGGGALAAAILALSGEGLPPGFGGRPRRLLTSALAAGGASAWLVLESP